MMHARSREKSLDWTELQASIVWSMYNGKWERPGAGSHVSNDVDSLNKLKDLGVVVDG